MKWNESTKTLELQGPNTAKDYICIDSRDWFLDYLHEASKGRNSFLFQLVDPNGDEENRVVKFCKFFSPTRSRLFQKRIRRFEREIETLCRARDAGMKEFLVHIFCDGEWSYDGKQFKYYVMEAADHNLGDYLTETNLSFQEKLRLCFEITSSLKSLHDLDIYHRDLKPDNILFVENRWKIGDLGLVAFRDEDLSLDGPKEPIGPFGFVTPEAVNKTLGNYNLPEFDFDYHIDDKSDVFQLAKIFWYIMQGEVPTCQIIEKDFKISKDLGFFDAVIIPALQYSKKRRPAIDKLQSSFEPICREAGIL